MIRRGTWIALALFAVVAAAAVLWQRSRSGEADTAIEGAPTSAPLWSIETGDVERLMIENGEGTVMLMAARDADAGWVLETPASGPADSGRLERAVSWLLSPPVRAELEPVGDLSPFELDPPRYTIQVALADGGQRAFSLGRVAPTGDTVYARFDGRPGILLLSKFGVDEVLDLLDPLPVLATSTPALPETAPSP
jgi:hypothetical protein